MTGDGAYPPGGDLNDADQMARIFVLGAFRVQVSGKEVPDTAWGRPAARRLLKLLAVHPGHRLHRERVHDELWPELGPDTVDASFRRALHLARHALEPDLPSRHPSRFIALRDDLLWLNDSTVWIDADGFETDLRNGMERDDASALAGGLARYVGDLLPEDQYEEWTQLRREQLANLRLTGELRIASLLIEAGQGEQARRHLEAAIEVDPASEQAYRLLMATLSLGGEQRQALRAYERCRAALEEELGIEPDAETEDLRRRIAGGEMPVPATAPVAPVSIQRFSLPRPALPFATRPHETENLFGRADELDECRNWLRVRHSSDSTQGAAMLVVAGDMGSGKTHLARTVAKEAHREGTIVLWGGWSVDTSRAPYSGFVQALDHAIRGTDGSTHGLDIARYPELDRLLPALAAAWHTDEATLTGDPQTERARLLSSVARVLSDLEATAPVLLVLDDMQDSDEASRELLEYLLRVGSEHRWAFLATVRAPHHNRSIGAFMTPLRRARQVDELRLASLSEESTAELIQSVAVGLLDPNRLREIYSLSLGNPLFTLELTREEPLHEVTGAQPLPTALVDMVLQRLQGMEPDAGSVAQVASAMGDRWTFRELQEVIGAYRLPSLLDANLLDVTETIERAGVIEERGEEFAFQQSVYRAALYESMSRERRRQLHHTIGETFERIRSHDVDALAFHFELAREKEKALQYLELAGDRALTLFANVIAEQRFRRVLETLHGSALGDRARVEEKLGRVLFITGRLDEAAEALESSLSWCRGQSDLEASWRVLSLLGRVARAAGRADDLIPRLEDMGKILKSQGVAGLAEVTSVLSRLMITVGRYDQGVALAEEAIRLSSESSDNRLMADAALGRATGLLFLGQLREGKPALKEAIRLGQICGDLNILQVALANLAEVEHLEGEFQESLDHHSEALAIVEQMGDPNRLSFAQSAVGIGLMMVGRWAEARTHLEAARDLAERENLSWYSSYPFIHLGRLELYSGRPRSAEQLLSRALELARSGADLQAERFAQLGLAESDLQAGRFQTAIDRLRPMTEGEHENETDITSVLPSLALAFMGVGDSGQALATAELGVSRATSEGASAEAKEALLVLGRVLTQTGDLSRAHEVLEEALEMAGAMGDLFAQARAEEVLAELLKLQGDDTSAAQHGKSAARLYRRIGAKPARIAFNAA